MTGILLLWIRQLVGEGRRLGGAHHPDIVLYGVEPPGVEFGDPIHPGGFVNRVCHRLLQVHGHVWAIFFFERLNLRLAINLTGL